MDAAPPPEPMLEAPPPEKSKPKPPPYSLPWALRPVMPGNVIRSDTSIGYYQSKTTRGGSAVASMLLASYKVIPEFAPLVRLGLVANSPPIDKSTRWGVLNPVIGGLYGPKISPNLKLGLFLGMTLPIGSGGGTDAHPQSGPANAAGAATRSAMDNAMFAANYLALFPGVGFAYVGSGLTAQVEATLFRLWKTRGPGNIDRTNTNFTTGFHLGYFLIPQLSVGAELRHQRWLSTPKSVEADKRRSTRDNTTFAIGPRAHVKLGESMWLRPGISFAMPLDNPLAYGPTRQAAANSHFKMVQIDVPFVF
jgi:hypothetical protein